MNEARGKVGLINPIYDIYVKRRSNWLPVVVDEYLNILSYEIEKGTLRLELKDHNWTYVPFDNIFEFTVKARENDGITITANN